MVSLFDLKKLDNLISHYFYLIFNKNIITLYVLESLFLGIYKTNNIIFITSKFELNLTFFVIRNIKRSVHCVNLNKVSFK